jgi:hypothetical protein
MVASGCVRIGDLSPPAEADAKTLILVIETATSAIDARAIDLSDTKHRPTLTARLGTNDRFFALYFSASLADLGISEGLLAHPSPPDLGRPLPTPISTFEALRSSGGGRAWMPANAGAPCLRLPGLSTLDCLGRGGCLDADPGCSGASAPAVCHLPCTAIVNVAAPEAPDPPKPPNLAPCPSGWSAPADLEAACEPPAFQDAPCAFGQAEMPWTAGCAPVGDPCPSGQWPDHLPASGVIYVRAGQSGGDGSIGAPFGTIAAAIQVAHAGEAIALSKGTYASPVALPVGLVLWGACVESTMIVPADRTSAIVTIVPSAGAPSPAIIRDVGLGGGGVGVAIQGSGLSVELDGISIEGSAIAGIDVERSAQLTAHRILVRMNRTTTTTLATGGLTIDGGTDVRIDHAAFEGNGGAQISASGSHLMLSDAVVRGLSRSSTGLVVASGASVVVSNAFFDENIDRAIAIDGGDLSADEILIRGSNTGLSAKNGAAVAIHRSRIEGCALEAAHAAAGASVTIEDAFIRRIAGATSAAIAIDDRATGTITRAMLDDDVGINIAVGTSTAVLTDVRALDSHHTLSGGSIVAKDSRLDLFRAELSGGFGATLDISGRRASTSTPAVRIRDVEIHGMAASAATGLNAFTLAIDADVSIARMSVHDVDCGIHTENAENLRADITDLLITHTTCDALFFGSGLITGRRIAITDATGRGVTGDNDTNITLADVAVMGTMNDSDPFAGAGLVAFGSSAMKVTGVRSASNASYGVVVSRTGMLDLHVGEISNNPVGVEIGVQGYDVARLLDRVIYVNNAETFRD